MVLPLVSFTRATFRLAELGFLGLAMKMELTTPFLWVQFPRSGDFMIFFLFGALRRVAWFKVANAGGEE